MKKFLGIGSKSTFKPMKVHKNSKYSNMSATTKATLGSGNLRQAVALPAGETRNEWFACNVLDFFNEVSLIYGLCVEDTERFTKKGEGFPPGFEYRWADGVKVKSPMRCSSPQYVDYVMTWVDGLLNDESVFPIDATDGGFPANFEKKIVRNIFKRLFRVFAIIYSVHMECLKEIEATAHLNTSFKHFMYFTMEYSLVDQREMKAIPQITQHYIDEFTAKGGGGAQKN